MTGQRNHWRSERASALILTVLILPLLIMAVGAAVDLGVLAHGRIKLQQAVDQAALAALETRDEFMDPDTEEIIVVIPLTEAEKQARAFITANMPQPYQWRHSRVRLARGAPGPGITVTLSARIPAYFLPAFGFERWRQVRTAATAYVLVGTSEVKLWPGRLGWPLPERPW